MNYKYVLDREKLESFLEKILNSTSSVDDEINSMVEGCNEYAVDVHSNNYFLSRAILKKIDKNHDLGNFVQSVYDLKDKSSFFLEEFDSEFITFMIGHVSNKGLELEGHLKEIQEDFVKREYGKQIRY